tara:strand:+ start:91 stop:372 length:282 start_codon:yes stop_codon:yes gene_type:complete
LEVGTIRPKEEENWPGLKLGNWDGKGQLTGMIVTGIGVEARKERVDVTNIERNPTENSIKNIARKENVKNPKSAEENAQSAEESAKTESKNRN